MDGIGDTIRISLSDDPTKEVKIGNEILRALLQLVELGCMLLLLPYSLFILMFPMLWLYEIVGWFAIILFPLIYVFIIVRVSEFYMKYKKNKSNDI